MRDYARFCATLPIPMKSRAQRRHERDRVIAKRLSLAKQFRIHEGPPYWPAHEPQRIKDGMLANRQAYLGCSDGKKCRICHPSKRKPTRQEMLAMPEINDGQDPSELRCTACGSWQGGGEECVGDY
jgi:hypothetical protein